jgi:hypothetical protein
MVLVLSFDEAEPGEPFHDQVKSVLEILKPLLAVEATRHAWVGVKEQAAAVLNTIGVD